MTRFHPFLSNFQLGMGCLVSQSSNFSKQMSAILLFLNEDVNYQDRVGFACASNFPGPEEHSLYLKILTSLPLWPYTSQAKACTHSSCSSDTVGTSPNTANSCM